ncbi:hypothetical protein CTAYLR_002814 [Chrysophaeum taylorii]|uniref:Copper transport protein n=1 Tax=Chrysophaeum taylorii TaxID=2483200 RepID=A0AAD7XIS6_9STRA|nr:hypothetical protein CTAYLR_002814 [Chrysophaeum taylorii]
MTRVVIIGVGILACALVEAALLWGTTSGEFCNGNYSMDMKMEGFKTIWVDRGDTGCVVMFNSGWVVRSRLDFLYAFVALMIAGAGSEVLGYARRQLRPKHMSARQKLFVAVAFTAHVILGYLLMLCAMTYQVEFLVAVSVGLGLGHFVFNADAPVNERPDPCCADDRSYTTEKSALLPPVVTKPVL